YPAAMAPPMAAQALGRPPFGVGDLLAELRWSHGAGVGLVEGVGGPRSPLAADGDGVTLARALRPDAVVLVAPAGLGALNAVLLCVDSLPRRPVVLLNRFEQADPLHAANRAWLEERAGLEVATGVDRLVEVLGARGVAR
ncbi:MAG: hypothetical protein ACLGIO_10490, partial [Acidimicrobiia bacterium]